MVLGKISTYLRFLSQWRKRSRCWQKMKPHAAAAHSLGHKAAQVQIADIADQLLNPGKAELGQAPRSGQAQTDETDQNRAEGRQAPPGEALVQEEHAEEGTEQHGGLAGSHNITHRS